MHYVYIVKCQDDTYYTGYTIDLERRIDEHNQGVASKYTRGRLPVRLVYYEEYQEKGTALSREYQIKKLKRQTKQKLIESGVNDKHSLSSNEKIRN